MKILTITIICMLSCNYLYGFEMNTETISFIESTNGTNKKINKKGAIGEYQITYICLQDYNQYHSQKISRDKLYIQSVNFQVYYWYMNKRIPQMLEYYGYKDCVDNRIICYDWGIGNFIKWMNREEVLPLETIEYIRKYKERN